VRLTGPFGAAVAAISLSPALVATRAPLDIILIFTSDSAANQRKKMQ